MEIFTYELMNSPVLEKGDLLEEFAGLAVLEIIADFALS